VWGLGHGTVLRDEGKAVGCVLPAALLFEQALIRLWILTWIKEHECDPAVGL
jgi:hypothetical protein